MENLGREKQIKKYITLAIITFLGSLIIIVFTNININNKNQIIKKLKNDGFKENVKNIYYKNIEEATNTLITNKKYSYNIITDEKNITITNKSNNMNETIIINTNNSISNISYLYNDNNGCSLKQKATLKEEKFKCDVISRIGACKIKCDILQSEAKKFIEEMNNYEKK